MLLKLWGVLFKLKLALHTLLVLSGMVHLARFGALDFC